jgi:(2Fe-2S) ferredoxin
MGKYQQKLIRPLVGHFLGWGDDRIPHRYIKVASAKGKQVLKVSKSLRSQIQDWQPGIWLTLLSQERRDPKTGEIAIKVKQLLAPPRTSPIDRLPTRLRSPVEIAEMTIEDMHPSPKIEQVQSQIRVCQGASCRRKGSIEICKSMQTYLDRLDCTDRVEIKPVKCLHQCKTAPHAIVTSPNSAVLPGKTHYRQLQHHQVKVILDRHFPAAIPISPSDDSLVKKIGNYLQAHTLSTPSII